MGCGVAPSLALQFGFRLSTGTRGVKIAGLDSHTISDRPMDCAHRLVHSTSHPAFRSFSDRGPCVAVHPGFLTPPKSMKTGSLKMLLRNLVVGLARRLGTTLRDAETGERIGKAFLIPWRGRILCIGLETPVRPVFLPQKRLTYWKQDLGFTRHPPPDFPRERDN